MNVLEFISSLAWPVVALIVVLLLRPTIARVLRDAHMKRVKAGPVEVEWERALSEVEAELDRSPELAGQPSGAEEAATLRDELTPLLEVSASSAVLESFIRVEKELRALVAIVDAEAADRHGAVRLARLAHERKLINEETVNAVQGLAVLRNMAAHGHIPENMSRERALEYVALADGVLLALRDQRELPKTDGACG